MADENIKIIITAEDKASGVLSNLGSNTGKLGSAMGGLAKVAGGVLIGAMGGLVAASKFSLDAWEEQAKQLVQMDAVLKSTANAVGLTKNEILDHANALMKLTTYGDEAINSAQNLLLTFTNIKGETFKDATKIVLDMSTALGQDLKSSAIQVGKALQDPILGVTALRRVGVNFNETQIETIKKLVESGQAMEAQKFILNELSVEFGGSAVAAASTFGGKVTQLKNQLGEMGETFGSVLAEQLAPFINQFTQWASSPDAQQKIQEIATSLATFVKQMGPIITEVLPAFIKLISLAATVVGGLSKFLFVDLADALGTVIFKIMQMIDAIKNMINWVEQAFNKIRAFASEFFSNPISTIGSGLKSLGKVILPGFQEGGIVPGALGMPTLAVVHGGETILPPGRSLGNNIIVNITGTFLSEDAADRLAAILIDKLKINIRI